MNPHVILDWEGWPWRGGSRQSVMITAKERHEHQSPANVIFVMDYVGRIVVVTE